jgi:hypothetical protein
MNFHRFDEILENRPKRDLLLAELKRLFPGAFLKTSEEFSPNREGGIWIAGREMADYYGKDNSGFGYYVNPRLQKTLEKHGFYLEPYDPETWFAWEVTPIRREAKDLLDRNTEPAVPTIAELQAAMRPIHALYGPVVQQRNMIDALKRCGITPPSDPGGGVAAYNDALIRAIRDEIVRRERELPAK